MIIVSLLLSLQTWSNIWKMRRLCLPLQRIYINICSAMGKTTATKKMCQAAKEMPKTKTKSKFVRVTREEALKNRVHTYPYFIN